MTRLSTSLMLLGLLGTSFVAASPKYDKFDQEEQHRNADCDNGCFFGSFPGGSCTNDAACMCTQQKYRERYFCCMAEKCAPSVLPDSVERQILGCEAFGMEISFDVEKDVEKVCGIKFTLSSSAVSTTAVSTATVDSDEASTRPASTAAAATADTTTGTTTEESAMSTTEASSDSTSEAAATPTPNSAPQSRVAMNGVIILIAAAGIVLS
ncbi:hypothetical protein FALBO_11149 [Fusarium albosuccineum]|uniref:Extracellular membrane protein CFEM domain-containing protein n=1 Tax=Fusarium albosuccineum TaxID=1237068 RepID=A0A8H4PAC1_9HYPO|nr:hypothetical protein FALBO_11149 [Fusarium albosuccineum]